MTLGPDDLPEDPFAEGAAQLFCVCTGATFHFVITESTVRAVCANPECGRTMGEYPVSAPPMSGPPQAACR